MVPNHCPPISTERLDQDKMAGSKVGRRRYSLGGEELRGTALDTLEGEGDSVGVEDKSMGEYSHDILVDILDDNIVEVECSDEERCVLEL